MEQFRKYRNLTELTRHAAVTLIDRIDVCEDCRIQIRFRYQDSYERALSFIESVGKKKSLESLPGRGEAVSGMEMAALRGDADVSGKEAV